MHRAVALAGDEQFVAAERHVHRLAADLDRRLRDGEPTSTAAMALPSCNPLCNFARLSSLDDIRRHDARMNREDIGVVRIDSDLYPMMIGAAECLQAQEIL
jgi:hypothetical protein